MILIGAHVSIAGGFYKAIERGEKLRLNTIQIFTKNQLRWISKPIANNDIELYKNTLNKSNIIGPIFAHGSYLLNLASSEDETIEKSINSLLDELSRCRILNLPYLIIHPGSHKAQGEPKGIEKIIFNLNEVLKRDNSNTTILVENTAGQGNSLGYRFEHIRDIIRGVNINRVAVCIDTCHLFAAGYDIRTERNYRLTIEKFDKIVGSSYIKVIHLNDSKSPLGSRIDRHMHIGRGHIGNNAFIYIMQDERFKNIPMIIETPKKLDGKEMDKENIELLKSFVE